MIMDQHELYKLYISYHKRTDNPLSFNRRYSSLPLKHSCKGKGKHHELKTYWGVDS